MILSVKERLVLSMIMEPQAGRYDVLRMVRKFREELSFSEVEIKDINLRSEEGTGFRWDKEITKDIDIGEVLMKVVEKQFKKLDREERLHEDHMDLYIKFVAAQGTA